MLKKGKIQKIKLKPERVKEKKRKNVLKNRYSFHKQLSIAVLILGNKKRKLRNKNENERGENERELV